MVRLAAGLPRGLPAAVFVVHHFPANSVGALPSIVSRAVQSAELGSSSIRHLLLNGTADPVTNETGDQTSESAEWSAQASGEAQLR